ncbi:hypothetical protein ACWA2B_00910 [Paenibacillus sp. CMM36]
MLDMIDEKLDFALAGLLGWVNWWDGERLTWVDGATKEFRRKVTDWQPSSDPTASLEVQVAAIRVNAKKYFNHLERCIHPGLAELPDQENWLAFEVAEIVRASPRQRAEAAYMTLSSHPLREDI